MRVLYVSDVYYPRVNGVSTSIRTFREDLANCGIDTLLVAPRFDTEPTPADDNTILRVPSTPIPRDPEDRRMNWTALNRVLAAIPDGQVDLVHIHTPFVAHYAGARFARQRGLPCVATYHTFFEEYLHHYVPIVPRPVGRFLARALTRSQCADVQALIAPTDPMRDALLQYGVTTPIHVVPTGIPADRFNPGQRERFRSEHGIAAGRPLVTYVGRVAHEKNIEFLITMFMEVRRSMPQAMLVIAGEGPARERLKQRVASLGIADDTHFAGYLNRNTGLLDCYAAADVFVFASRTETQGLVLLEAMAQGAPIVSTAELGTKSILKPNCGALVVPEQVPPFAAAVVRVLQDESLRRTLASQGIAAARTWASATLARQVADLYESLRLAPRAERLAA